jgi:Fic family protein
MQKHYQALPQERITPEMREIFEKAAALVDSLEADEQRIITPMTSMPRTAGEYVSELLKLEPESLVNPMRPSYIHFFHRLLLMGIIAPSKAGRFRRKPVHVGNPNVFFATPSAIPGLMEEFCRDFPTILPTVVKYDQITIAARMSHRFVSIHPYEDGNGRISRVLMNLVLWGHFPPVYLKADAKGRHRYSQALRRADRGDFEGLGALICLSLIEIYEKMLGSLGSSAAEKSPF